MKDMGEAIGKIRKDNKRTVSKRVSKRKNTIPSSPDEIRRGRYVSGNDRTRLRKTVSETG